MGRPKKQHYSVNQPVVFIWSGKKRFGKIDSRTLRGKKMYYDVLGDDNKLYEELYTDDSEIACILTKETALVNKVLEQRKGVKSEATSTVVEEEDDLLDDEEEQSDEPNTESE